MSSAAAQRLRRAKKAMVARKANPGAGVSGSTAAGGGHGGNPNHDQSGRFGRGSGAPKKSPNPRKTKGKSTNKGKPRANTLGSGKAKKKDPYKGRPKLQRRNPYAARPKVKGSSDSKVGGPEHGYATHQEKRLAHGVGGKHVGRREWVVNGKKKVGENLPFDALKRGHNGKRHALEVKTMLKGDKKNISVHNDALKRKVDYATKRPNRVVHTVVNDHRDTYSGGEFRYKTNKKGKVRDSYSGHDLYYKRGSGAYTLKEMHKVKDHAELERLIHMEDHELPMAARAGKDWVKQTTNAKAKAQLAAKAKAAHAARLKKDMTRKRRIAAEKKATKES